ncbi:hypothetical protein [Desulfosporosinus lacus]|uniref:hypothetical protein n=1 Tax=Desulfosporosinus lacus TaxID=329936 RepID=UPI001160EF6E|nr:hypothetical protein [Desulfosporosinus lacus]
MKMGALSGQAGRAVSPHPARKLIRAKTVSSSPQHSEARPLTATGATPNLRVVPDVNHGFAIPAAAYGLKCLSMQWVRSCGRICPSCGSRDTSACLWSLFSE